MWSRILLWSYLNRAFDKKLKDIRKAFANISCTLKIQSHVNMRCARFTSASGLSKRGLWITWIHSTFQQFNYFETSIAGKGRKQFRVFLFGDNVNWRSVVILGIRKSEMEKPLLRLWSVFMTNFTKTYYIVIIFR